MKQDVIEAVGAVCAALVISIPLALYVPVVYGQVKDPTPKAVPTSQWSAADRKAAATSMLEGTFNTFDSNKDGKITMEEHLAPDVDQFKRIDTNGDGVLDSKELYDHIYKTMM